MLHLTSIKYKNYKSFSNFSVSLSDFNILVGPNNAGKSTVIGSLKLLSEGIRRAKARKPIFIENPEGHQILGYELDLSQIPVATENVFHNYDDSEPAVIRFRLSSGTHLQIFFPKLRTCYFNVDADKFVIKSPSDFKREIPLEIGYVPILGPVDHIERLYLKEAARLALLTHTASRNFRNIWYHYGEDFNDFREKVKMTWPGMDISPPEINTSGKDPTLDMFCPEDRIPREIYWAGFGFQVWCQMLTFIVKNRNSSLFLIDEPDIYLHSDLQRQLLGILKALGPDIILATHSTEMISEADLGDILLINKSNRSAKRIKDPTQLREIFQVLGSNLNPVLTQIAKSKRVLFVEGKDFLIFSKIARVLEKNQIANRSDFAVVPVEGFNPTRLRAFKDGIEKTIGSKVLSAVIFDKDYRSDNEVKEELNDLKKGNFFAHIHNCKEVENFLLVPTALDKAIKRRLEEVNRRTGSSLKFEENIQSLLSELCKDFKHNTYAQMQSHRFRYQKSKNPKIDESTITIEILKEFDDLWNDDISRLSIIPGKEFIGRLNYHLQNKYKITITYANIIRNMKKSEVPIEMIKLIDQIEIFSKTKH